MPADWRRWSRRWWCSSVSRPFSSSSLPPSAPCLTSHALPHVGSAPYPLSPSFSPTCLLQERPNRWQTGGHVERRPIGEVSSYSVQCCAVVYSQGDRLRPRVACLLYCTCTVAKTTQKTGRRTHQQLIRPTRIVLSHRWRGEREREGWG